MATGTTGTRADKQIIHIAFNGGAEIATPS